MKLRLSNTSISTSDSVLGLDKNEAKVLFDSLLDTVTKYYNKRQKDVSELEKEAIRNEKQAEKLKDRATKLQESISEAQAELDKIKAKIQQGVDKDNSIGRQIAEIHFASPKNLRPETVSKVLTLSRQLGFKIPKSIEDQMVHDYKL